MQDLYYPFMDLLHSDMQILREGYTFADLQRALDDRALRHLRPEQALLVAQVLLSREGSVTRRDDGAWVLRADSNPSSRARTDGGGAGILVRKVFNDAQRSALVDTVAGSLLGGVREPVLGRAFEYWKSIDAQTGRRVEDKVRSGKAPKPAEGMGER